MYTVTSIPFFRRTRATLRRAEFGFFGVIVNTRVQVPEAWGHDLSAGDFVLLTRFLRALRINWLIVGKTSTPWLFPCLSGRIVPRTQRLNSLAYV
jgi:hypothetical protein